MSKIQLSFIKIFALLVSFTCCVFTAGAQQSKHYNLVQLLKDNKLVTTPGQQTQVIDRQKQAISTKGIVWLKGVDFKQGTIEVDLRGKDVFLQSFLGIAFHAPDTATYDVVYFRPFNFRHADTLRRKWSVQYMSIPDYDYVRLRKEHPLVYENAVDPVPNPNDWFHATIVVKDDWITIYVDHSEKASLKVKLLNNRKDGMIGLWTSPPLSDDFANLTLTQ
ncbi:MAG: hypothetical protein JWP37_1231 [Mucilaginibacter sp.]|nr:hypothetical protein [Mucilaginibacter sp.]